MKLFTSGPIFASLCGFVLLLVADNSAASDAVLFEQEILPLLQSHCVDCHGANDPESGLRVDRRSSLIRGGDSGEAALTPNQADGSLLLQLVRGDDADRRMPPEGESLSTDEIALLSRWIDQGAKWPGQMPGQKDAQDDTLQSDHWSLQPFSRPKVPRFDQGNNAIDAFINKRLDAAGLTFSPPADSISIARRVSFVLTGLPPSDSVTGDAKERDYATMVDELLASPEYGQRWAQHWLDVIRWAETVGFETNSERKQAWPYRDWVIDAFNSDKPYDQFIREQILGDELGQDAALGFLVAGPANLPGQIGRDEEAMRQSRQDELDEVIQTVSQGIMGLTIGCARCHNHKFDPILQKDYYSLQAIFAGMSYGDRRLRGEADDRLTDRVPAEAEKLRSLIAKADSLRVQKKLRPPLPSFPKETFDPILADGVRIEIMATNNDGAASLYELQAWTSEHDNGAEEDVSKNASSQSSTSRNIALASNGSRVSASSFALANQTRHFDNLIDGSSDRRQAFPWVAAKAGPAWAQVDFANSTMINAVAWDTSSGVPVDLVVKVRDVATGQWRAVATSRDRMLRTDDIRKAESIVIDGLSQKEVKELWSVNQSVNRTRLSVNRLKAGSRVYAARFSENPAATWQLRRGDPMQRIAMVPPSTPVVLGALSLGIDAPERTRRQALVSQLTSPHHPLTARVIVNRIWQHHFGIGIVETPSDFGKMGSLPSHPQLLDWLASELVDNNWSLKHIHRLILNSKTFQQSSVPRPAALQLDADSRLLWRFPPRRIEAESIRDSILQASGKLNSQMGGRGFNLFQQRGGLSDYKPLETFDHEGWRRMIYAHKIRMQSVDVFGTFDCPDAGQMKPRRTQSITPLQSLSLLNSPFVNRQAAFFASRIEDEVGADLNAQIDRAFEIAFSRKATDPERIELIKLVRDEGLMQMCRVLINTSEFLYLR
ncbi:PSD1 and planctomycete cytochrome C domain-containing protein [Planctomycetes bacterium K23_9]|uniref:Planctomycete cytochrome C n=1 Tax=Stieleria marina TaxID=1930275 RepID=A0A517NN30_9BACT|nr:Planctomycete cytochrome C [Planctomycetes bacterium K23_9]